MSGSPRPQPRWSRFHARGSHQPARIVPSQVEAPPSLPAGSGETPGVPTEDWLAGAYAVDPLDRGEDTPAPGAPPDDLPPAFQLRHIYVEPVRSRSPKETARLVLGGLLLFAAGGAAGWLFGTSAKTSRTEAASQARTVNRPSVVLSEKTQAEVDDAFEASKARRYQDAQMRFDALRKAHPEWPSMAIEDARAAFGNKNPGAAAQTLTDLLRADSTPDADLLLALTHLAHREFAQADEYFDMAAAFDPARPDTYYFWGECLRAEGKPRAAAEKFRSALLRNRYETAETLFQLKLWLSQIQSNQEESAGIDAALAIKPRPPYSAFFAAAARSIKANGFKDAAAWIGRGQLCTEPSVFRLILDDPLFSQESWRPELREFYK